MLYVKYLQIEPECVQSHIILNFSDIESCKLLVYESLFSMLVDNSQVKKIVRVTLSPSMLNLTINGGQIIPRVTEDKLSQGGDM